MDLINPTITVRNTNGPQWLVRMEHRVSEMESIDITLLLPRSTCSVPDLQVRLAERAAEILAMLQGKPGT